MKMIVKLSINIWVKNKNTNHWWRIIKNLTNTDKGKEDKFNKTNQRNQSQRNQSK